MLDGLEGVAVVELTIEDVVRHRLVKEIIKAYAKLEEQERIRKDKARQDYEEKSNGEGKNSGKPSDAP
jgi:hypothetical protein